MGISAAIAEVQALIGSLDGIRGAPIEPPESINQFPFAVAYLGGGTWAHAGNWKRGLHDIVIELHINRADLPRDIRAALKYSESVPDILMSNPRLNETVDHILTTADNPLSYEFGPMEWGSVKTLGYRWRLTVKMQSAIGEI
jgi:hypothetical protein